ncbi:hypothetical protein SISNIDRAFT_459473, partial [Sistotremastrum niveocremeum HHB9708]
MKSLILLTSLFTLTFAGLTTTSSAPSGAADLVTCLFDDKPVFEKYTPYCETLEPEASAVTCGANDTCIANFC